MVGRISKLSHSLCGTVKTNKIRWFVRIAHQYDIWSRCPCIPVTNSDWVEKKTVTVVIYVKTYISLIQVQITNHCALLISKTGSVLHSTICNYISQVTFTAMKPSVPRTQSLLSFSSILWTSPRRTRFFLGRVSQFPMFLISISDHVTATDILLQWVSLSSQHKTISHYFDHFTRRVLKNKLYWKSE